MDRQLIEAYVAYAPRLRQAVAGLSSEELTARPGPGNWSILELVLHLTDSESIAIDRMKRMLTEDNPQLLYADETAYVDRLFSHEQSLEDALTLFEVGRRQFARVLRKLPEESFERRGTHNRRGPMTVGGMVKEYNAHVDHHLKFLYDKRARLGKRRQGSAMIQGLRTAIYPTPDLARGKEWYRQVLGRDPYFDEPFYVGFSAGGFELGLIPDGEPGVAGVQVFWGVPDAAAELARLTTLGAEVHEPVKDVGGGIKVASVRDPFGNLFSIIENPHFKVGEVR